MPTRKYGASDRRARVPSGSPRQGAKKREKLADQAQRALLERSPDAPGTVALAAFIGEHLRLREFQVFLKEAAETAEPLLKAELARPGRGVFRSLSAYTDDELKIMLSHEKHQSIEAEFVLCAVAENCLTYLSDLLTLIFSAKPETLRSEENVSLQFVLQHATMKDLIDSLARRKVDQLAYKSLDDLAGFLESRLGLALTIHSKDFDLLSRLVAYRNLFVHNRGIVNDTFLRKYPDLHHKRGDRIDPLALDVNSVTSRLWRVMEDLDIRAQKKFNLPAYRANFVEGTK